MKQNGKSVSAMGNEKRNLYSRQQLTKAELPGHEGHRAAVSA